MYILYLVWSYEIYTKDFPGFTLGFLGWQVTILYGLAFCYLTDFTFLTYVFNIFPEILPVEMLTDSLFRTSFSGMTEHFVVPPYTALL